MQMGDELKPLFFLGSTRKDLKDCPPQVRQIVGFALYQAQIGMKHLDAKPLKGFGGAGVLEVVADHHGSAYRGVYTVKFAGFVYALHVFQKKSKKGTKTPKHEVDLIKQRLRAAKEHYEERHVADQ